MVENKASGLPHVLRLAVRGKQEHAYCKTLYPTNLISQENLTVNKTAAQLMLIWSSPFHGDIARYKKAVCSQLIQTKHVLYIMQYKLLFEI